MSGSQMQIQNANETDVGLICQSIPELCKFYSFAFEWPFMHFAPGKDVKEQR